MPPAGAKAGVPIRYLVTGCAGFIGSNLVDRLLSEGHEVVGIDNFSTGQVDFLAQASRSEGFTLVRGDLLDWEVLSETMRGVGFVYHLAANADIRDGLKHPRKDLEQNTLATFNMLEAMRAHGVRRIAFASSGAVYGEPGTFPTPEDAPFPVQTSLYGASKLAGEALISAYCEGYGFQGFILRFVSILGERYSHGHVFDFYRKLLENPDELEVLGDGKQRKSYLYIGDCVEAMRVIESRAPDGVSVFNLGSNEYCTVNDSLGWIVEHLGLSPRRRYTGGDRGWVGDNPFVFLDTSRLRRLGWSETLTIRESVTRTVQYLEQNRWLFDRR